jgi:hypothetical protein
LEQYLEVSFWKIEGSQPVCYESIILKDAVSQVCKKSKLDLENILYVSDSNKSLFYFSGKESDFAPPETLETFVNLIELEGNDFKTYKY